jgi:hypothetical protein
MTVKYDYGDADTYFQGHKLSYLWFDSEINKSPDNLIILAENMIQNTFNLRQGADETSSYAYAVYEQAVHILSFDKERYLTQSQGVKLFSYDGIQVQQDQSLISPIAFMFLKKLIYRKVGDIK